MSNANTTTHATPTRPSVTVRLQTPIARTGETIEQLTLLKPRTADLRGIMLADLLQLKADTVATVLPRISQPTLAKHEVDELDTVDLVACAVEVAGFLVPTPATESPTA